MAKKSKNTPDEEAQQRQSRKDILIARKHERQLRNVRIAIISIAVLIALVIGIALVNELIITPDRTVATVGDSAIKLREWEERVKFERAQRIIFLENQLEAFGGDVGIIQQFAGNVINELFEPETMGQNALNTMANEIVMCNALKERGVEITDADIQAMIGESYGFFGAGISPTQPPPPTATIQPTPSLTPIPTAVITEVVPTVTPFPTPTAGPTSTPAPTPTPLSEQNFLDEFGKYIGRLNALGVSETTYRTVVRAQLCSDRLTEILTEERALSTTAPQASLFVITATTEEAANEMKALIDSEGYLAAWNTIMSRPDDLEATESPETDAFELLWRTRSSLETSIGADVAAAAFDLDIDVPSDIIAVPGSDGTTNYLLVMVSGREERELSESEFQTAQSSLLQSFIDEQLTGKLQINDMWRSRVPTLPALDPKFLAAPTPTPAVEDASPTVAP
ncbi:MAG: SurA N-terminal domain-containing protein [Anaerolineae bacterium]|nr:SurA N-terminal domain-containing protein [Anaerolineae bacterium]RIK22773.1 MAG: hypothetical protein DCC51_04505 [Anaerolineae bacterium]